MLSVASPPPASLWTTPLSGRADAPLRLFVFPFAGGGSVAWRGWAKLLPADWLTEVVLLPGRETRFREPPFTDMATLVAAVAENLPPRLDRPFAFYGHSLGAAVAFETALALEARGRGPAHLFVSGRRAPGHPRLGPAFHNLSDAAFRSAIGQLGGTPKAVLENDELMEMFLPLLRADFSLSDRYEPLTSERLACPVTAFGGLADGETDAAAIAAWAGVTTGPALTLMLPGDHFFIQPQAETMIAQMQEDLAKTLGG